MYFNCSSLTKRLVGSVDVVWRKIVAPQRVLYNKCEREIFWMRAHMCVAFWPASRRSFTVIVHSLINELMPNIHSRSSPFSRCVCVCMCMYIFSSNCLSSSMPFVNVVILPYYHCHPICHCFRLVGSHHITPPVKRERERHRISQA